MKHLYQRFLSVTLFFVCTLFAQQASATIYTVTNNSNVGAGSLADAIATANTNIGLDTIEFNIPEGQSFTITVTFTLAITDSLFINGYSQPGAATGEIAARTIRINVEGTGLPANNAIFSIQEEFVTIAGLAIYLSPDYAIRIETGANNAFIWGNYIGTDSTGLATGLGNTTGGIVSNLFNATPVNNIVIGSNLDNVNDFDEGNLICSSTGTAPPDDGHGITLWRTDNSIVANNIIGLNKDGTGAAFGNAGDGMLITVNSTFNVIGTNSDGNDDEFEFNIVSGNGNNGIRFGSNADNNRVSGNIVGLDANSDPAPNGATGVQITNSSNNRIGTDGNGVSDIFERNIISSNGGHGVGITTEFFYSFTAHSTNNVVAGNIIGTDATGTLVRGNDENGIYLATAEQFFNVTGNRIGSNNDGNGDDTEGNLVVNNGFSGIVINTPVANTVITGNRISRNIVYNNTDLGIDIGNDGVTSNDDGDGDTGSNDFFNAPVITTVQIDGSNNLVVTGFTRPGSIVEFYIADAGPNPNPLLPGYTKSFGEGQTYLFRAQEEATLGGIADDSTGVSGPYDQTTEGNASGLSLTETKFSFKIPIASLPVPVTSGTSITAIAYDDVSGNTSEFGGGVSAVVTPVTLTSFKGRISDGRAELSWTTSEEHDNSHFDIEKSANGVTYSKVGSVVGLGGINNQYSFTDAGPLGKVNHYRLKQVDIDGKSTLSRVLVLRTDLGLVAANATPNPFTSFMNVSYKLEKEETIRISLYDRVGRVVKQYSTRGKAGINTINLNDLGNLPRGSYFVEMRGENMSVRQQVIKQ
jgi:hypothetical protein